MLLYEEVVNFIYKVFLIETIYIRDKLVVGGKEI